MNQHASSLYIDASFLTTPSTPKNWTLQSVQRSFLSVKSFLLLLLPLTTSAGSWEEWQVPFLPPEEGSVILLLCRNSIYIRRYGTLLEPDIRIERHMYFCLVFAYIHM